MVEISAVNIVMRRNAVNFDIIFFINLDFFYKWCPVLFNVHSITINLENNNKQDFILFYPDNFYWQKRIDRMSVAMALFNCLKIVVTYFVGNCFWFVSCLHLKFHSCLEFC